MSNTQYLANIIKHVRNAIHSNKISICRNLIPIEFLKEFHQLDQEHVFYLNDEEWDNIYKFLRKKYNLKVSKKKVRIVYGEYLTGNL
uniref:Uncharacterized protein n=1 Tax=Megaviridae environmental sample TaxID=1737588 RepID=A0A5J6VJS2_9VIRU|nr:MAG: hypothetical protein [Megaviridae environmental sample]